MKLLLYCTKAKPYLNDYRLMEGCNQFVLMNKPYNNLNGKVVAECDYEVEEIIFEGYGTGLGYKGTKTNQNKLANKSCLYTYRDIDGYLKGKNGYAIHIKNLNIFDELMGLSEYNKKIEYKKCDNCEEHCEFYYNKNTMFGITNKGCTKYYLIRKAPQNMMYCYDGNDEKYVLISIQPKWLCKILNGEKTIEIRKVVLKEMLNDKKN